MKSRIKNTLHKLRYWLLKKLFTEDEKFLMIMAIECRQVEKRQLGVNEKFPQHDNSKKDIKDYDKIRVIFITDLYC